MEENKLLKQTMIDSQAIKSDKHPKALYIECLSNNSFMRHYAAQKDITIDEFKKYHPAGSLGKK
jgi:hypothetical protein